MREVSMRVGHERETVDRGGHEGGGRGVDEIG